MISSTSNERSITFGTDGIRGNAELFPFTDEALDVIGRACAAWAFKKYNKNSPKILIGTDTRISGPRIKQALANGLRAGGVEVWDADVISTPAICYLSMYKSQFDAGIVISASHNPFCDNGIKIFDSLRCKITPEDEQCIIELFKKLWAFRGTTLSSKPEALTDWSATAAEIYRNGILSRFPAGFLKNVKVILDCANGATFQLAPSIFRELGAIVETIAVHPDGKNINNDCGALHTERLVRAVLLSQADAGFAFDGDGDRLMVVNSQGVVKDGDDVLDLLLDLPAYQQVTKIVGTVMTNQGFEQHLKCERKSLLRTPVGDKYVAAKMEEEGLALGGELSGHTIIRDFLPTSDGIFVALKVLESIIVNKNWDMRTFVKFPQVLINVPVAQKKDLKQPPFAAILSTYEQQLSDGRMVVRFSGTENLLRVMVEASAKSLAETIAHDLAKDLQEALKEG